MQRKTLIQTDIADLVLKNARFLNVFTNQFEVSDIAIAHGYFVGIGHYEGKKELDFSKKTVVPGFIDGHIHLESSLISPPEFTRIVAARGTTTVIYDPHEIANVLGTTGLDYMLAATQNLPVDFYMMLPSCVPATIFDESGASLDSAVLAQYIDDPRVLGLGEMMNYPGVLNCDEQVLSKIELALQHGKRIDGHAPALCGHALQSYLCAGIHTDHECTTMAEAVEKLRAGQWIMIREGTACKNLKALSPLICEQYHARCLFCSDDRHPTELLRDGHIDYLIRMAIARGADPVYAYKLASWNAACCFGLSDRGAIAPGYLADFVVLDDVKSVGIESVFQRGVQVAKDGVTQLFTSSIPVDLEQKVIHSIHTSPYSPSDFAIKRRREKVIGLLPNSIHTADNGEASEICIEDDILKLCVVERHHNTGHIGVAFLKGYGLRSGAIATSIAHDSHNIIVCGASDHDIALAVNRLREIDGGMVIVQNGAVARELSLPIAGIMCSQNAEIVADALEELHDLAHKCGVPTNIDPFMTLSFAALPVIPTLKMTTLGVVDVEQFKLLS